MNYTWNAEPGSWWSRFNLSSELNYFAELDGTLLNKRGSLSLSYNGIMQSNASLGFQKSREAFNNRQFDLTNFIIHGGFWPTSNLQLDASVIYGDQIDFANTRLGKRLNTNISFTYNLGKHLRFSLNHIFEDMTVYNLKLYTANISQLTAIYQFNVRTFFRAIIQYVNYDFNPGNYTFEIDPKEERFFNQLLFSYKIDARTVFFLGYTDNYLGSQFVGLTQTNRTFFLKLGYAWVP